MNGLTVFGLLGVTAMLVCYALESRSPWFVLGSLSRASGHRPMGFCKARGRSDSLRRSGRLSHFDDGGCAAHIN
jgi:hypothetical protein